LRKRAQLLGLLPASVEFDTVVNGVTYRCQAFRKASERNLQYGLYCVVGDWSNVKSFTRAN